MLTCHIEINTTKKKLLSTRIIRVFSLMTNQNRSWLRSDLKTIIEFHNHFKYSFLQQLKKITLCTL